MDLHQPIETLLTAVATLDRPGCVRALREVPHLRLDFTDEYLQAQSIEGLRHLLAAAVLQARRHLRDAG